MEMNVAIAICTITYQSALDHSDCIILHITAMTTLWLCSTYTLGNDDLRPYLNICKPLKVDN